MRLTKHVLIAITGLSVMLPLVLQESSAFTGVPATSGGVPVVTTIDAPRSAEPDPEPQPGARATRRRISSERRAYLRALKHAMEVATTTPRKRGKFGLMWPVPYIITGKFGPRNGGYHHGLDTRCPQGMPILAAAPGKVVAVGRMPIYGGTVIVKHNSRVRTLYAHLSKRNVRKGQLVGKNTVIGFCGNTGHSFGPHLHFEVYYSGRVVNPKRVLPKRRIDVRRKR